MDFKAGTVSMDEVDLRDHTFKIRTSLPDGGLQNSIASIGLINPPILLEKGDKFSVIAGFSRTSACLKLGFETIPARIVAGDAEKVECAKTAIAENSLTGELNPVETANSYALLLKFLPDREAVLKTAGELGLPSNPAFFQKTMGMADMPQFLKDGVADGFIPVTCALELKKLPPDHQEFFTKLFCKIRPSLNKQMEILTLSREIAKRDSISMLGVFELPAVKKLPADGDSDPNGTVRRLRGILRRLRYPAITRTEKEFERVVSRLKPGKSITILPPPNFESGRYRLTIEFKSLQELEGSKTALDGIIADSEFAEFMENIGDSTDYR